MPPRLARDTSHSLTMKERALVPQGVLCIGLCSILCSVLHGAGASSLMRRIREKQSADHALKKGLDLESDDWIHVPQPVQDVLMSIDDKLRSLDTLSYTLKLARLDFSLDQMVKRMENIETKLGRLETKFDVRMEKVEEIVISKDIKEEFSNEHLSRRMDNLNEKINNKAAYLDAKLDIKFERMMNKLELLERDLHSSVDDILEKLIKSDERHGTFENEMLKKGESLDELSHSVQELKIFLREDLPNSIQTRSENLKLHMDGMESRLCNGTSRVVAVLNEVATSLNESVATSFQESNMKIDNLSFSCRPMDRTRSIAESCDDSQSRVLLKNLTTTLEKTMLVSDSKFQKFDSDVGLYFRKVVNNIQDLWKTADQLKDQVYLSVEQDDKDREFMRLEFRKLYDEMEPISRLEKMLSDTGESLDRRTSEVSATVDRRFATLLLAQNSFIDSCRRIQEEETQVYNILQHIVYEMRNRSEEDMRRISSDLELLWTKMGSSLQEATAAAWAAGNTSAAALQKLQQHLKPKDKCVLKADDIKRKVIDSVCRQVAIEMPSSSDKLVDIVRSVIAFHRVDGNVIHGLPNHSAHVDNQQQVPRSGRNAADTNSSAVDYETDYPLSDADYSEHLHDK